MRWLTHSLAALGTLATLSCSGPSHSPGDLALDGLTLIGMQPSTIVPGTRIVVEGRSFVDEPWGRAFLTLDGDLDGNPVSADLPARFVDFDHLEVEVDGSTFAVLGADAGQLQGNARVSIDSSVDGTRYQSPPIEVSLTFAQALEPSLDALATPNLVFVNSRVEVSGSGFLLGGDEGETRAIVEGQMTQAGGGAVRDVGPIEIPLAATDPFSRQSGWFPLVPELTGIEEGSFSGTVRLYNAPGGGGNQGATAASPLDFEMLETTIYAVSPATVSLGQYLDIEGGGFVGDGGTSVRLEGTFTADGTDTPVPFGQLIEVVPAFVDGEHLRYVINEEDLPIDVRTQTGVFEGQLVPIVGWDGTEVEGESVQFSIRLAPVKQVVYLRFNHNFVEALRDFGLRAVESHIRDRVVEVVRRDYATINLDVRTEPPTDFALYAEVEIGGPDPQGLGLLGYDNTPGKDTGNMRLYDRLGGVNARTQQDGFPGYGGVFVTSLFAFSKHPISGVNTVPSADSLFDDIFDPFRPDRSGDPVRAADLQSGLPQLDGASCPGGSRAEETACAIYTLGNLIGTTLSHEIGHSLGLANPYGSGFHNLYDEPNRLMDGGADRPFTERAELMGDGPARFCEDEYQYLRLILPTNDPADTSPRPPCS